MRDVWGYSFPKVGLTVAEEDGFITGIFFDSDSRAAAPRTEETPLIKRAAEQLYEYFKGERRIFDLPVKPAGTEFQKKVWGAVSRIPYGETRTYKEIAIEAGNALASRAVGMANHHNHIVIVIPCHRVIGHNGALTGYGGGLDVKKYLLELEKAGGRME